MSWWMAFSGKSPLGAHVLLIANETIFPGL